ncbi:Crp/Fnr family transcriptional regulator [uncultured Selenomonas sp.]|uniref:Crp/Fnr family transcriptional regulator n=1 Tax=uncultured Selenomonas sp. TaxID=159275 RepID=UPI0028F0F698|nr:Crp/Fnr family transcriptional regulator [uncultured Selenomonas sp.]
MTHDKENAAHILAQTSLAEGMNKEEIAELLASSDVGLRIYPKGAIVFHDGEMPHSLYILLEGEVHILKDTYSGRQIFISEIDRPGDMFGEVYEVLKRPYDMYVRAVTKVKLLEVSSHFFTLDLGETPRRSALIVQRNLMKIFAGKAYGMHTKLKILASGTLREKIVRYLFPHIDDHGNITLTVSREFMASYLAVSRPSLSRELSAMQREGIIEAAGRTIHILDMEQFESYL